LSLASPSLFSFSLSLSLSLSSGEFRRGESLHAYRLSRVRSGNGVVACIALTRLSIVRLTERQRKTERSPTIAGLSLSSLMRRTTDGRLSRGGSVSVFAFDFRAIFVFHSMKSALRFVSLALALPLVPIKLLPFTGPLSARGSHFPRHVINFHFALRALPLSLSLSLSLSLCLSRVIVPLSAADDEQSGRVRPSSRTWTVRKQRPPTPEASTPSFSESPFLDSMFFPSKSSGGVARISKWNK